MNQTERKITIIGCGPAGSYTAMSLAKQGFSVDVYEEHKSIGKPLACTGIVTRQIENFVDVKKITVNTIQNARIIVSGEQVDVGLGVGPGGGDLVIDRVGLDRMLAGKAESAGAKICTNTRYLQNTGRTITVKDGKSGKVITKQADLIIGADGPASSVAKSNSLYNNGGYNRKFWIGTQAQAYYPNEGFIEFYPCIGTYAWVVPENKDTARIGVCTRIGDCARIDMGAGMDDCLMGTPKELLDSLLKQIGVKKIISRQGGLIPQYDPRVCTQSGNVFLVGDAAGQVKATTGGGIVQSLIAARALSNSIKDAFTGRGDDHNKVGDHVNEIGILKGIDYEKSWRREMGTDLWIHLKIREIMDRFQPKDWQYLLRLFQQEKLKKILEQQEREYPSRFIAKKILREPRLLLFGRFLMEGWSGNRYDRAVGGFSKGGEAPL